ncbi:hypothetical protein BH11BAC5_BH11BAC5_14330 [soil metagenome]
MKKYFYISALSFTFSLNAFTQNISANEIDSLSIDSLKKALPSLKDNAKVDCLNQIAMEYNYSYSYEDVTKMDSIYYYGSEANKEATKLGYKKGIGFSLVNLSRTELFANKNIPAAEKNIRESILIGESINNPDLVGWAYYELGEIDQAKNNSQDASANYRKAINYFQISGNEDAEAEVSNWLCFNSLGEGKYEDGFAYCERCEALSQKSRVHNMAFGHFLREFALKNMGDLYKAAGDYETAMEYFQQARKQALLYDIKWTMEPEIGELFCYMGKYDSAFVYIKKYTDLDPNNGWAAAMLGETYLMNKQYDTALHIFKECIYGKQYEEYNKQIKQGLKAAFLFAGKAYIAKKNYANALKYTKEGLALAKKDNEQPLLVSGYEQLSKIYYHMSKYDSAYNYLLKYTTLKDSIVNRQFLLRLNNYKKVAEDEKKKAEIGLLNKDIKIKSQQLKQETQQKYFLLILLSALMLAGFFVYRSIALKRKNDKAALENALEVQQLENEKKHAELQRRTAELEMQALRAQMNPHFIFNCLSSINRFILLNKTEAASDYLTRFSRLIRMVLVHSQEPLITLEDELEILRLYLDMEQLRFKDAFDYQVIFTNRLDTGSVFIPSLLLQPFCENAIWHGLMHKEKKGNLQVALSMEDQVLHCTITDDGIGRKMAAEMKSKSTEKNKSLGLKITRERLALLNRENGITTSYEISDVLDQEGNVAGTKVELRIRYKESAKNVI